MCILLVIALSIVALSVAIYNMCNVDHCKNFILLLHLGICSAGFTVLVLADKSFCGRQTADDVLKTASLYVIIIILI